MGESHAYGVSLFIFSRRQFIMGFSALMFVMCLVRSLVWAVSAAAYTEPSYQMSCIGAKCYEVFSCYGMKATTYHVLEPMLTLTGLIAYPLGFQAAMHAHDLPMKRFAFYVVASAIFRIAGLIFDFVYLQTCDAYDQNLISFVLANQLLPPSPLSTGIQATLRLWTVWPKEAVDNLDSQFNIVAWDFGFLSAWAALILYAGIQAFALSHLMEHGPYGLGVHFGIDQWDEVLNYEGIRRKVNREMRSKFIDDATLPLAETNMVSGTEYGYGASATWLRKDPFRAAPMEEEQANLGEFYATEEDEAEAVRVLAERLAAERDESPEAILNRAFD